MIIQALQVQLPTTLATIHRFPIGLMLLITKATAFEVIYSNFTGNFVYIRAKVVYTDGTINNIRMNPLEEYMENFINIVFDTKQEVDDIVVPEVATSNPNVLLEEETGYELYDTDDGKTVPTVETHVQLDESIPNKVAEKIAPNFPFRLQRF